MSQHALNKNDQESAHTILIVDDDQLVRASVEMLLRDAGYSVRAVGDAYAAIDAIKREVPRLLISDLDMPGMSGFELLAMVNKLFPKMALIAMSGAFCCAEPPRTVVADAYVEKGTVRPERLLTLVATLITEKVDGDAGSHRHSRTRQDLL